MNTFFFVDSIFPLQSTTTCKAIFKVSQVQIQKEEENKYWYLEHNIQYNFKFLLSTRFS